MKICHKHLWLIFFETKICDKNITKICFKDVIKILDEFVKNFIKKNFVIKMKKNKKWKEQRNWTIGYLQRHWGSIPDQIPSFRQSLILSPIKLKPILHLRPQAALTTLLQALAFTKYPFCGTFNFEHLIATIKKKQASNKFLFSLNDCIFTLSKLIISFFQWRK